MAKKTLFVDTGAWFALADKSDEHHNKAIGIYPKLLSTFRQLITTNLVISETYILIRRSMGHQPAMTFLDHIAASPRVITIHSDSGLEENAVRVLREYKDQALSYTDAVSVAVMRQWEIEQAFSFDQHFATLGFTLLP